MEKRENESINCNEALKAKISIRCAKAALLLSKLNSSQLLNHKSTEQNQHKELEAVTRELRDLRFTLANERVRCRMIKLSGLVEFALHVVVVLFVVVFNWMIVYEYF